MSNDPNKATLSDDDDFDEEDSDGEFEEDDEGTLDEEESLLKDDEDELRGTDELRMLEEESEMSVEELRRKYAGGADLDTSGGPSASTSHIAAAAEDIVAGYFSADGALLEDDEDDAEEYSPPTDPWKKAVRVGPEYQVETMPDYIPVAPKSKWGSPSSMNGDGGAQSIWIASAKCPQRKVERYLEDCEKIRAAADASEGTRNGQLASFHLAHSPTHSNSRILEMVDDENALYALLEADYDTDKAKAKAPFPWANIQCINGARLTYTEPWRAWSEADCTLFEQGLLQYGKNFFSIHINEVKEWVETERNE